MADQSLKHPTDKPSSKAFPKNTGCIHILFASLLFFTSIKSFGSDTTGTSLKSNIVFATFGGKENFGSVNYEHIFSSRKKLNLSYSIGIQPFQLSKKFSLPVSINAFTNGRLHHFEVDVTATFYMDKYHPYNGGWKNDFNKQLYLSPFVCYRLQGSHGILLKAGVGPQVVFDPPSDNVVAFKTKVMSPSVFGSVGIIF